MPTTGAGASRSFFRHLKKHLSCGADRVPAFSMQNGPATCFHMSPARTGLHGGAEGDRTPDLCIANAALSHLSYSPLREHNDSSRPWEKANVRQDMPGYSRFGASSRAAHRLSVSKVYLTCAPCGMMKMGPIRMRESRNHHSESRAETGGTGGMIPELNYTLGSRYSPRPGPPIMRLAPGSLMISCFLGAHARERSRR